MVSVTQTTAGGQHFRGGGVGVVVVGGGTVERNEVRPASWAAEGKHRWCTAVGSSRLIWQPTNFHWGDPPPPPTAAGLGARVNVPTRLWFPLQALPQAEARRGGREAGRRDGGRHPHHDLRVCGHVLQHAGAPLLLLRLPGYDTHSHTLTTAAQP